MYIYIYVLNHSYGKHLQIWTITTFNGTKQLFQWPFSSIFSISVKLPEAMATPMEPKSF